MNDDALTEEELYVTALHRRASERLLPGTRIRVVKHNVLSKFGKGKIYQFCNLQLWKNPDDGEDAHCKELEKTYDKGHFIDEQMNKASHVLYLNDEAIVLASLPSIPSVRYGSRHWCLLLSSSSSKIGWSYNLDGLEILSPVKEST